MSPASSPSWVCQPPKPTTGGCSQSCATCDPDGFAATRPRRVRVLGVTVVEGRDSGRSGRGSQGAVRVRTGYGVAGCGGRRPGGLRPTSMRTRPGTTPTTEPARRYRLAVAWRADGMADLPPGSDPIPERHQPAPLRSSPVVLTRHARYAT